MWASFFSTQWNIHDVYQAETSLREAWQEGQGGEEWRLSFLEACFSQHVKWLEWMKFCVISSAPHCNENEDTCSHKYLLRHDLGTYPGTRPSLSHYCLQKGFQHTQPSTYTKSFLLLKLAMQDVHIIFQWIFFFYIFFFIYIRSHQDPSNLFSADSVQYIYSCLVLLEELGLT